MTQITEAKSEEEVKHITKQLLNKTGKIKSIFTSSSQTKKNTSISTHLRLYTIFEIQLVPQQRPKVQEDIHTRNSDGLFTKESHGLFNQFSDGFLEEEIKYRII